MTLCELLIPHNTIHHLVTAARTLGCLIIIIIIIPPQGRNFRGGGRGELLLMESRGI